jgi:hypothetical protein
MMQTDVAEVFEPSGEGRGGSSCAGCGGGDNAGCSLSPRQSCLDSILCRRIVALDSIGASKGERDVLMAGVLTPFLPTRSHTRRVRDEFVEMLHERPSCVAALAMTWTRIRIW